MCRQISVELLNIDVHENPLHADRWNNIHGDAKRCIFASFESAYKERRKEKQRVRTENKNGKTKKVRKGESRSEREANGKIVKVLQQ
jgi:hypothetical protein